MIIYLASRLATRKDGKTVFLLVVLSFWSFQIHFSGILTIPCLILLFIFLRVRNFKQIIGGLLVGLLPLTPYLLEQNRSGFRDLALLFSSQRGGYFDFHSFITPFRIGSGFYFARVLGADYFEFFSTLPFRQLIWPVFNLMTLLVGIGLLFSFFKGKKTQVFNFFFLLMMLVSFLSRRPAMPFYEELYFTLIFIFAGLALTQLSAISRYGRLFSGIFVSLIVFANLVFLFHFYRFVHLKQQIQGDYGLVYSQKKVLIDQFVNRYRLESEEKRVRLYGQVIFSNYFYDTEKKTIFLIKSFCRWSIMN